MGVDTALNSGNAQLVPIRLALTLDDGVHVQDTFCLSLSTQATTLASIAQQLCIDAAVEATPARVEALLRALQKQLDEARLQQANSLAPLDPMSPQRVHTIKYVGWCCMLCDVAPGGGCRWPVDQ